eukprot:1401489-Amphidinium_carterae.1
MTQKRVKKKGSKTVLMLYTVTKFQRERTQPPRQSHQYCCIDNVSTISAHQTSSTGSCAQGMLGAKCAAATRARRSSTLPSISSKIDAKTKVLKGFRLKPPEHY